MFMAILSVPVNYEYSDCYICVSDDTSASNHIMASQLHNIRMKLEEKRRRIESEKRRMEVVMSKQRQKVGKAAFLQAVTKVSTGVQDVEEV